MKSKDIKITGKCIKCKNEIQFCVYETDYKNYINEEKLVQQCFPYLSSSNREFLISGYCEKCQEDFFIDHEEIQKYGNYGY